MNRVARYGWLIVGATLLVVYWLDNYARAGDVLGYPKHVLEDQLILLCFASCIGLSGLCAIGIFKADDPAQRRALGISLGLTVGTLVLTILLGLSIGPLTSV